MSAAEQYDADLEAQRRFEILLVDAFKHLPDDTRALVQKYGITIDSSVDPIEIKVLDIPFAYIPKAALFDRNATGATVERIDTTVPDTLPEEWTAADD